VAFGLRLIAGVTYFIVVQGLALPPPLEFNRWYASRAIVSSLFIRGSDLRLLW
jgi:hypothetical protein